MMPFQRARVAESRVRNKSSKGVVKPGQLHWIGCQGVFHDVRAYVSCRGYDGTLQSARPGKRDRP